MKTLFFSTVDNFHLGEKISGGVFISNSEKHLGAYIRKIESQILNQDFFYIFKDIKEIKINDNTYKEICDLLLPKLNIVWISNEDFEKFKINNNELEL